MRKPQESIFAEGEEDDLLPLSWQYADSEAIRLCLDERFLLDTILEDDYIAYIVQLDTEKQAYLMFMVTEKEPYFHIDINYAKELINAWTAKGYKTYILRSCISAEYNGKNARNKFSFGTHISPGRSTALHELKTVNGKDILVFYSHPCWEYYYRKLIFLSHTHNRQEYECLFEIDTLITKGEEKTKDVITAGIGAVIDFLNDNPIQIGYSEFKDTETYSQFLLAGDKELNLFVNRRNLICELNIKDFSGKLIRDESSRPYGSLIERIPTLLSVRALDPQAMHGYAIQLAYADNSIRNYYMNSFDEPELPTVTEILGCKFTKDDLFSAKADSDGNVRFRNGFIIPKHFLYYLSYRQVQIEYTNNLVYAQDGIEIKSVYKLPLNEFKSHFSARQYRGRPGECFGPKRPWIDAEGKRVSDIAISSEDRSDFKIGAAKVCVEPTAKYGYLNDDGTWLVPPIYEKADKFSTGSAKAVRKINGVETTFLLTEDGKEKPFPYDFDVRHFYEALCPFNTEKWNRPSRPDPGYYYDFDEVIPGKWGFVDADGKVVVEPQYVYAVGFDNGGGEHSVVARFVDGELCWGVIDKTGAEVIPCEYPGLYCRWGEAVAFQREKDGDYGLMDFDGNVIVEPMFGYIEEYDPKHNLISAGDSEDDLGVYSVALGKMITPAKYDCIDFDDHMISCEIKYTCNEEYYDYDGKRLPFDEYSGVFEDHGLLKVWKDGKLGVIDWDGTVIVPPVMENGLNYNLDYYRRGYLITGSRKLKGLSKVSGETILPEVFTEITLKKDYVIASLRTSANWSIKDSLYALDGKLLMEGPYRNMYITGNGLLSVETPTGVEHFVITPY